MFDNMNTPIPPRSLRAAVERWIWPALWAGFVAAFLYSGLRILFEPHVLNYTEGIILHATKEVLRGNALYQSVDAPPYNFYAYGPLHSYVSALFLYILGPTLLPLRLLTLLCEIVLASLCYRILRGYEVPRSYAVTGALLTLAMLGFHKFHAIARVDMLMLVFEVWALSALLLFLKTGQRRHLVAVAAGVVLALLVKVSSAVIFAGFGAVALLELRSRRSRGAWLVAALAAAVFAYGLIALLWSLATEGYFYHFQITYQGMFPICNPLREDCSDQWLLFPELLGRYGSFVLLALASALVLPGHRLLKALCALSWAWFAFSILKSGADHNYSLEPLLLSSLIVGLALPRWRQLLALATRRLAPGLDSVALPALIVLGLSFLLMTKLPVNDWNANDAFFVPDVDDREVLIWAAGDPEHVAPGPYFDLLSQESRAERRRLAELMAGASGVVLSEEPYFAALADKPLWLADPFAMHTLSQHGVFDPRPLIAACREGRVQWVFAGFRLLQIEGMKEVLESDFEVVYRGRRPVTDSFWTVYRHKR